MWRANFADVLSEFMKKSYNFTFDYENVSYFFMVIKSPFSSTMRFLKNLLNIDYGIPSVWKQFLSHVHMCERARAHTH